MAKLQADAGLEALMVAREDRMPEMVRIAEEADRLRDFLRMIEEFENPNEIMTVAQMSPGDF